MAEEQPPIIAELERMRKMGQSSRDSMEKIWETSHQLVEGSKHRALISSGNKMSFQPIINRIANSVNLKYAALTEMQERPIILPRGKDAPAEVYFSFSGKEKAAQIGVEVGESMTELEVEKLMSLPDPNVQRQIEEGRAGIQQIIVDLNKQGAEAQARGEDPSAIQQQLQQVSAIAQQAQAVQPPPFFVEEDFVRVTDDFAADAMTEELQSQWLRCKADMVFGRHKYQKVVIGHSDMMIQWDEEKQNLEFLRLDPYNVWIDPLANNTFDAAFAIVRQIIPVNKAKKLWPAHAEEIELGKESVGSSSWKNGYGKLGEASIYGKDADVVERITAFIRDSEWESGNYDGDKKVEAGKGLRQVELLGNTVLFDGPCGFSDIPVCRDINIPRTSSNYGVGDPEYLWDLQSIYHRLMSIVYENALYSRAHMHLVPVGVLDNIRNYLESAYTMAGQFIPVSDAHFMQYQGKPIHQMEAPQLSPIIFSTLKMISDEIDRLSGQTDIMRGETLSGQSGVLYEQATSNARSPIGMSARHTVQHIKYLAGIGMKSMLENLSAETLHERNRAYPVEVWQSVKDRLEILDYDFEVQVSGASKKASDSQKMIEIARNIPQLMMVPDFVKQLAHKSDWADADRIAKQVSAAMSQPQQ